MTQRSESDVVLLEKLILGQLPVAEMERLAGDYADDARLVELAESLAPRKDTLLEALSNRQTIKDSSVDLLVSRLLERLKPAGEDETMSGDFQVSLHEAVVARAAAPERLEYFRILSVLGEGGMGTVYLAEDTRLGRSVALKTLRRELAAKPTAKDRFLREARSAAHLEHDHIIPIYYVGEGDGIPFLAMPFLQGESLDRRIHRATAEGTTVPVAEALTIARQIASGLALAHARGLIHRDIKPGNVWLEAPNGRVKILDFGLARSQQDDTHLTATGVIVGTPAYMSPEQGRGLPVDPRSDLFSLGCVLYEMLTGKRPFTGGDTLSILTSLAIDTPPLPHEENPHCPAALSQLTMQLLAKKPGERPACAQAVVEQLARIETPPVATAVVRPALAPNAVVPATPPPRRLWPVLVAVAALALLPVVWWLATVVLRVETDHGTLLVEIDDADTEARVKNGKLILYGPDGKVRYTLEPSDRNKKLDPGAYKIRVEGADGLVLDTTEFTLKKGDKVTVRVKIEPTVAVKGGDAERRAAEWFLKNDATIAVEAGGKVVPDIRTADQLPQGPFTIRSLQFSGKTPVDASLDYLRDLKGVETLILDFNVADGWLEKLAACPDIAGSLRALYAGETRLTDAGIIPLQRFTALKYLNVGSPALTDKALAAVKKMKLLGLGLNAPGLTDAGVAHLQGLADLEWLALHDTAVGDAALAHLKTLPALRSLILSGGKFTEQGLKKLAELPLLNVLTVHHLPLTDEGLAALKACKGMYQLNLANVKVTDAGLVHLTGLEELGQLCLDRCAIGDDGLTTLAKIKTLNYLSVQATKASAAGVKKLAAALPRCTIVSDHGTFAAGKQGESPSPYDKLDAAQIPADERFDFQPKELVAVIGTHAGRTWGAARSAAISPDGKWAAVNVHSQHGVVIWDLTTQKVKWVLQPKKDYNASGSVAFTPDGRRLYVGRGGHAPFIAAYDMTATPPQLIPFAPVERKDADVLWLHLSFGLYEDGKTLVVFRDGNKLVAVDTSGAQPKESAARDVPHTGFWHAPRANRAVYATENGYRGVTIKAGQCVDDPEPLKLPKGAILRQISPDGKLAVLLVEKALEVWSLEGLAPARVHLLKGGPLHTSSSVSFSPDGRWLALTYSGTNLYRIDGTEARHVRELDGTGLGGGTVAFSRVGDTAITCNAVGIVRFWDLTGDAPKELSPFDPATAFGIPVLGHDAQVMLPRHDAPLLRHQLWDLAGKSPRPVLPPSVVLDVKASHVAPVGPDRWFAWNLQRNGLFVVPQQDGWRASAAVIEGGTMHGVVSQDGKLFASVPFPDLNRLVGWDLTANPPVEKWSVPLPGKAAPQPRQRSVLLSADGRVVAVCLQTKPDEQSWELAVWRDPATNAKPAARIPLRRDNSIGSYCAALSPDGKLLAHTKQSLTQVVVEDLSGPTPREVARYEHYLDLLEVRSLAFHPDGKVVALACATGVRLFDVAARKVVWRWDAPGVVDWVSFTPDGRHLLTHNANQTVYVLRFPPATP